MDPEPSSRLHSRVDSRVASNADTRSETWSAASSTIVDTRSEPPRCYGKDADKIMRRATGKSAATSGSKEPMATPPVTLTAKIATKNNNSNNNNGSSGSGSGSKAGSKSSKASASVSVASSAISGLTKQSTVNNNNNAKKSSSSSKSSVSININRGGSSSTSASASAARSIDSSKKSSRSKKSSSSKAMTAASASSKHHQHGRTTSPSVSASIRSSSSNKLSSSNNNNKSSSSSSLQQQQHQSSNNHRHYGDAETTNSNTNSNSSHSHHSGSHISGSVSASAHAPSAELSNLALVPMTATAAAGGAMDPPSGASTSGSSSSTECTGPTTLYDPPTTDGNSTYASGQSQRSQYSQMSGSVTERSVSPNNDQLAVWSEGNDNDEDTTTLRSDAISGASSESSYYSSDDDDDEDNEGGEQRALVPIAEDRSSTSSEEEEVGTEDSKNARALVQSDYHGGVNSHYDGDKHHGGAIVAHADPNNRFLATAVDNHHAIVPIDSTIYEAYDHTFVTCPENLRFRFLYTFLKKNLDKKVMIFFSTTNSAKFHARLLSRFNIPVLTMHGNQRREKFIGRFFKFSDLEEGILCATDGAGRDLDIPPSVDWVIQFEPPDDPSEYILRVARISCDSDRVGRSLLFLNPGEQGFLKYYHSASIPVSEFEIPRQLADVQGTIERHVNDSERLLRCARDAYGSYLLAYASHGFRDVYNVHDLNKGNVALGFGLVGTLPGTADDMTTETDTLVSSYVNGIGGGELGGDAAKRKSSGSSSGGGGGGSKKSWEKKDKPKSKSWMRGEKSWPHSQIKLHPKFKGSDVEY